MSIAKIFGDNPFVRALGAPLSLAAFPRAVETAAPNIEAITRYDSHLRMLAAEKVFEDVVVSTPTYYSVYTAVLSAMLRHYSHVAWDAERIKLAYGAERFPNCVVDRSLIKPSSSVVLTGPSGAGKTTMLNTIATLWPVSILHKDIVRGQTLVQVPVIYVQLTGKVREKSLFLRIIEAIDERVGGHELIRKYNYRRLSEPELRSAAQLLCLQFNVGVIVVDEAQRLGGIGARSPDDAINELLFLRDGLGIPTVFIGTYAIVALLDRDERLYRRASENGIHQVGFSEKPSDPHWGAICEAYWKRLLLRRRGTLSADMRMRLFAMCAGTPWALKQLLLSAQRLALTEGAESLTRELLDAAYSTYMMGVDPLLSALRTGDPAALKKYENMYHPIFDPKRRKGAAKERAGHQHALELAA